MMTDDTRNGKIYPNRRWLVHQYQIKTHTRELFLNVLYSSQIQFFTSPILRIMFL